ncbi:MAG: hypothetical protein AB7H93_23495 [Vicinamibacterales bacterium]
MPRKLRAYADRAGVIRFAFNPIPGHLPLPPLPRRTITATARLAYDGRTLLVPGVPEAVDDDDALAAFEAHCAWLEGRLTAAQAKHRQRRALAALDRRLATRPVPTADAAA